LGSFLNPTYGTIIYDFNHVNIFFCGTFFSEQAFLVPKPQLGNALAGEVPRLPVTGDGPKPGLRVQMRSQAGAWERGSWGLGTRKAGAWERGSRGLGTRKPGLGNEEKPFFVLLSQE